VGADLRRFREELGAALPLLQSVPREVGEVRGWLHETSRLLLEVVRQLREAEQQTREARGQLDELRRDCEAAEQRLATLRGQAAEAEGRLAAVRQQARDAEEHLTSLRSASRDAEGSLKTLRQEFDDAQEWLQERRRHPPPSSPKFTPAPEGPNRLGATVDPGVVVAEVVPDTPAEKAGLAPGDVIVAVGETAVFSGEELRDLVHAVPAGEEFTLRVQRAGTFEDITVRLEPPAADAPPPAEGPNRLGVTVEPGVVIAEVVPGSPAAHAGLERGDVILQADGTPVVSGPQLRDLIQNAPAGSEVTLQVDRGDALFVAKVQVEPGPAEPHRPS
jgi:flagellar biosynthesis chaperone FliJ